MSVNQDIVDYDLSVRWVNNNHWKHNFKPGDKIVLKRYGTCVGEVVSVSNNHPVRIIYKCRGGGIGVARPSDDVKYGYSKSLDKKIKRRYPHLSLFHGNADKLLSPSTKTVYKQKKSKSTKTNYIEPKVKQTEENIVSGYDGCYVNVPSSGRPKNNRTIVDNPTENEITQVYKSIFDDFENNESADVMAGDLFNEIVIITDEDYESLNKFHSTYKLLSQSKKSELADKEIENYIKSKKLNVPKRFQVDDTKIKRSYDRYLRAFKDTYGSTVELNLSKNINLNFVEYTRDENKNKKKNDDYDSFNNKDYIGSNRNYNNDNGTNDYADYEEYYNNANSGNNNFGYTQNYNFDDSMSINSGSSVYYDTQTNFEQADEDQCSYYSSNNQEESISQISEEEEESDTDYYSMKSYNYYDENNVDCNSVVQSKMETWQRYYDKYSHLFDSNQNFMVSYQKLDELLNDGMILEGEYYNRKIDLIIEYFDSKHVKTKKEKVTFKELDVPIITSHF